MNTIKCVAFATKFYSKVFIQSVKSKLTVSQFNLSVQTHQLIARGYTELSASHKISQEYKKKNEEKLQKLLEESTYRALYDKYKLEIEFLKSTTNKVPEQLSAYNWLHLMQSTSRGQRRGYLEHLWKIERKTENRKKKQELRRAKKEEEKNFDDGSPYGLSKCTLFHRIQDKQMNHFYNGRLISAMLHEPTVVFDLSYDEYMAANEQLNCAKQILLSFSANRVHDEPFNLYLCNARNESLIMQKLHQVIPTLYDADFPLNITSKSYLELFDKKKLVYLTPHTNNIMKSYDPELIYIIGGMVDKANPRPVSFQKANRENIPMMQFPLSQTLQWGMGSRKNLPLNQVLSILLDLRHTNNWNMAFNHVPKRKLKPARDENLRKLYLKRQIAIDQLNVIKFALYFSAILLLNVYNNAIIKKIIERERGREKDRVRVFKITLVFSVNKYEMLINISIYFLNSIN
ncbi:tRNA methyltransferase roswell [Xylocopa sonorina]|uniref:tRNA methyltransferase roswell n=1 Tax=Xylocopa sonorina TaxID=1818115 RepID=UPI00403AC8B6